MRFPCVTRDQRKAAELILAAIKMLYDLPLGEGRFAFWGEELRKELQVLVKEAAPKTGPSMAKPARLWGARSKHLPRSLSGEAASHRLRGKSHVKQAANAVLWLPLS